MKWECNAPPRAEDKVAASLSTTVSLNLPQNLPDAPHQPELGTYPKRSFGVTKVEKRSFQSKWFKTWKWLHCIESKDVVFCHTCVKTVKGKEMVASEKSLSESPFISGGFSNWKDATRCFGRHEESSMHLKAVEFVFVIPRTHKDIKEMLCSSIANQKQENHLYLMKVTQNIKYLAYKVYSLAW